MASTPDDDQAAYAARDDAPRDRSLGEHIFIWIAWALAAAFWGATMTTMVGILRAVGQTTSTISAPGAPGGTAYLALVIAAFAAMALALAYASLRSAQGRSGAAGKRATAARYDVIERQGGENMTRRSPGAARVDREFR